MVYQAAPFHADIANGPDGGAAYWVKADDGVRARVGLWPKRDATGTVILLPGRTEYIEKYGLFAAGMAERGFATLAIDWRGQGLADRMLSDARVGHVNAFPDFQRDLRAALDLATEQDLPRPWHLLGHSMGGAIGLRAVMDGVPVASCVFSGPMWDILMAAPMRPFAHVLTSLARVIGRDNGLAPTTEATPYVVSAEFTDNQLTNDAEMYQMMRDQLAAYPDLCLGGPSLRWLGEALRECKALAARPSPDMRCLTFLGTDESIVDPRAIHDRMARWPRGRLELVQGGRHEVLMDAPAMRNAVMDQIAAHFRDAT